MILFKVNSPFKIPVLIIVLLWDLIFVQMKGPSRNSVKFSREAANYRRLDAMRKKVGYNKMDNACIT